MNLLPKSSEEFSSQEYWNTFFSKRKAEDAFEWYGEYPELATLLHKYISPKDNLLIVGCGNSSISYDLYRAGIKCQKSVDISAIVIKQMKGKYPELEFVEGDVTKMSFTDNSFSCIFDKGTFDALSPVPSTSKRKKNTTQHIEAEDAQSSDEPEKVDLMLAEVTRTLKPGGRFVCISLLQPHVATRLLSYFNKLGWMIRVSRCLEAEEKTASKSVDEKAVVFPVFMVVFTKLVLRPSMPSVLEASSLSQSSFVRFKTLEELLSFVKDQQNFALLQRGINRLGFCVEKEIPLELTNVDTGATRFLLYIVEVSKLLRNAIKQRFGVFVVPAGRESEWLFGSPEGRLELAQQANFTRLVVVHLLRDQTYGNMNAIQEELMGCLGSLSPACVKERNIKAPIMTVGSDVGERKILHQSHSEFSGDYVVEDVKCEEKTYRRLIFLNNPNTIQSEVELEYQKKRGKEYYIPIFGKLACEHHRLMTLSFGFLESLFSEMNQSSQISALLIGLGGGLLSSFLINFMPNLELSVVEIDSEMLKVAKDYFGLPTEKINVIIDDGLKFIQSTESQYNLIFIDADSKSTKEGLSCPPADFLEIRHLSAFRNKMKPHAIMVLNLVCRNEELKKNYLSTIHSVFPFVLVCNVPNEVNTILFCLIDIPKVPNSNSNDSIALLVQQSIQDMQKHENAKQVPENSGKKNSKLKKASLFDSYVKELVDESESLSLAFKILKL